VKISEFEARLRLRAERAGVTVPAGFPPHAERYYDLLRRWNRTTNLTSFGLDGYPQAALDRLLIEPLQAAELISVSASLVCFDIGSGGGSPAIPFAIARPSIRLLMIESVAKKAAFLREAAREAELHDVEVITGRAEEVAETRSGSADLILIRAVKVDERLEEALVRLIKPDGRVFTFGGTSNALRSGWRIVETRRLSTQSELLVFQAQG
jgi:16S rRNA (guanine527-N7)-methyltransferase